MEKEFMEVGLNSLKRFITEHPEHKYLYDSFVHGITSIEGILSYFELNEFEMAVMIDVEFKSVKSLLKDYLLCDYTYIPEWMEEHISYVIDMIDDEKLSDDEKLYLYLKFGLD